LPPCRSSNTGQAVSALNRFSTNPVPAGAKMIVVFKAMSNMAFARLSHAIEFALSKYPKHMYFINPPCFL